MNYFKSQCPRRPNPDITREHLSDVQRYGDHQQNSHYTTPAGNGGAVPDTNEIDHIENIPCELCNEPIEWKNFEAHSVRILW